MASVNLKNEYLSRWENLPQTYEDLRILMEKHVLDEVSGDNDIIAASTYIRLNSVAVRSITPLRVPETEINRLYADAASHFGFGQKKILGIAIHLGCRGNNVHFVFEPICFELINEGRDANHIKYGLFDVKYSGKYYHYDGDKFGDPVYIEPTEIADYKINVEILKRKKDGYEIYKPGSDTKKALVSFQEVFTLLQSNMSDELSIYNCIKRFHEKKGFVIKHSIVLASEETNPTKSDGDLPAGDDLFINKYANLIHLCPPNCGGGGGGGGLLLFPLEG